VYAIIGLFLTAVTATSRDSLIEKLADEKARPSSVAGLRVAFERGLEKIPSADSGERKEAIFRTAALLGGVVLARAVQDPRLSDDILKNVRQKLD